HLAVTAITKCPISRAVVERRRAISDDYSNWRVVRLSSLAEARSGSGHLRTSPSGLLCQLRPAADMLFLALDAGILDDFGPFDDVGLDDGGELRGGAGNGIESELSKFFAHVRLCCDPRNLLMQLAQNGRWRAGRREEGEPRGRLEIRVTRFRNCWQLGDS